jgi:hypothetical protein
MVFVPKRHGMALLENARIIYALFPTASGSSIDAIDISPSSCRWMGGFIDMKAQKKKAPAPAVGTGALSQATITGLMTAGRRGLF